MKTPMGTLENVLTEVDEARTLLLTIMRNTPDDEKTDSALACLARSLERTLQVGYEYIDDLPAPPKQRVMMWSMMFFTPLLQLRNLEN